MDFLKKIKEESVTEDGGVVKYVITEGVKDPDGKVPGELTKVRITFEGRLPSGHLIEKNDLNNKQERVFKIFS